MSSHAAGFSPHFLKSRDFAVFVNVSVRTFELFPLCLNFIETSLDTLRIKFIQKFLRERGKKKPFIVDSARQREQTADDCRSATPSMYSSHAYQTLSSHLSEEVED